LAHLGDDCTKIIGLITVRTNTAASFDTRGFFHISDVEFLCGFANAMTNRSTEQHVNITGKGV